MGIGNDGNFRIPLKANAEFPRRKTFCMSSDMATKLEKLEAKHDIDVPQLIRDAIDIHLKAIDKLLNPPASVLKVNVDSQEINRKL